MAIRRIFNWFFAIFGTLTVAVVIFVVFFLEDVLVDKLTRELKRTFHDYYSLDYESMQTGVDFNGLTITIHKPVFKSDTTKHELNEKFPTLFFHSEELELRGISIRTLLFSDDLELYRVRLKKPELKLIVYNVDTVHIDPKKYMRKKIGKRIRYLMIDKINIEDGNMACSNYRELEDTTFLGYHINASVESIHLRASNLKTLAYSLKERNNFAFSVDKAYLKPFRSNYLFYMDSLILIDNRKTISAKNISATTEKSKLAVSKQFHYSKAIAETNIGSFFLKGYNLRELMLQKSIVIHSIRMKDVELEVFKNRKKQLDVNKEKLLLHEMLVALPFEFKVDSVHITRANLNFEMINHKTKVPLLFYLGNMNVLLTNVNTIAGSRDTMVLKGRGKFMGGADFNIRVVFPDMFKPDTYYSGKIGPMSFKKFNDILASYSDITVVDGKIHAVVFSGRCNKYENFGSLVFTYNDLQIEAKKKDNSGEKSKLVSMLGNIVLHNNNPRHEGEAPVRVNYYLKREKYRGHVVLLFGAIMEGMKNTLMDKGMQIKVKKIQGFQKRRIEKQKQPKERTDRQKLRDARKKKSGKEE